MHKKLPSLHDGSKYGLYGSRPMGLSLVRPNEVEGGRQVRCGMVFF